MPRVDKNFARCSVTWTIKNYTPENASKISLARTPTFQIWLGNNETIWHLTISNQLFSTDEDTLFSAFYLNMDSKQDRNFHFRLFAYLLKSNGSEYFHRSFTGDASDMSVLGWNDFISHEELFDPANNLLVDGELTVQVKLELLENDDPECAHESLQLLNYEKMINNLDWCDLVCVCIDGRKVLVNHAMIALQCPTLSSELSKKIERYQTNEIVLHNVDSQTFREFLRFIYGNRVENMEEVAMELMRFAFQYGVKELEDKCAAFLMGNITEDNAIEVLVEAAACNQKNLKNNCINFINWKYNIMTRSSSWPKINLELLEELGEIGKANFEALHICVTSELDLKINPVTVKPVTTMLVVPSLGVPRLIKFVWPKEEATVYELLEEAGMSIDEHWDVECIQVSHKDYDFIACIKSPEK